MCLGLKRYLLYFANEHNSFRLPEITAIAKLFKIPLKWIEEPSNEPFWLVELPSEDSARLIASRSVCIRRIVHLWASATNTADLHSQLREQETLIRPYFSPLSTFKIKVDTFCNHQTQREKLEKIESFSYLPIQGSVKLNSPDLALQYFEHYGMDPNNIPNEPNRVFFGRIVGKGRRDLMTKLNLKKRKFIGNTSMDAQLSLIMANIAQVRPGDLVLDPFVGSGSLLIAAASFGGFVFGTDIDFMMLHAKTKPTRKQDRFRGRQDDESVMANFDQYQLTSQYLDVVVADASVPLWRDELVVDAIITDPPYGIRESIERVGSSRETLTVAEENRESHIPSKTSYSMEQLVSDLLCFAAKHLRVGGRLVTWIPIFRDDYDENALPEHPCLQLVANCEQILSTFASRRLLTYHKHREPTVNVKNQHNLVFDMVVEGEGENKKRPGMLNVIRRWN
ncbi:tRNA (guanine(10)-N2)-methyltransferase homolog isoform X2 [Macrosteles quadrilineatus]|uniref:tRNA (guanine(10)-N2)-methyltransferase homolog isoform X2 n=1 Tax=Macrosteles quadrilineatus TaxID=74068 RepID=UPI0023E13C1B|nr:tRNA (guanine(10)-N2)-methyltransferase homolog isoform X2 [Macrosteles quadrilineatus]